ncbi:MAG: hypothetical protein K9G60_02440 [Pseudolabrys sp.]|nr:hypothetical protein [Pseudolabrys sp.]
MNQIDAALSVEQLDQIIKGVWGACVEGRIAEDEAGHLQTCVDQRRPKTRRDAITNTKTFSSLIGRTVSRFKSRQHPRSPDRKASRDRRRTLGGAPDLPPELRSQYTEGQRAVLAIIAGEVKHHGICDLPIDKIAALAGVCRTLVQGTLHEARRLGHINIIERPQPGQKSLTNIVKIASSNWSAWIKRGSTAHRPIGSTFVKMVSPTKSTGLNKKRSRYRTSREKG